MHRRLYKPLIGLIAALAAVGLLSGVAAASQPKNYWLVSSTGQVFAYGKAKTHGSEAGKHYSGRITGIKGTANGGGYWIVTTKKHYGFGDVSRYKYRAGGLKRYMGKVHPKKLRGKVVGYALATILATTKSGGGGTKTITTPTTTMPTANCASVTIQTGSLPEPTATSPYSQALSAGGLSGGSWSWTLKSGDLPTGLSLSSTGVLSGTPAESAGGVPSTFMVEAINSQCSGSPASRSFTVLVGVPPLSITTQTLNGGQYGVAYNQVLSVTGGQPGDYEWSATGLPAGLSLSSSGVLSGSPATTGTFNGVQITVTDTTGDTAPVSAYLSITITLPPLQIITSTLNGGQDTVAYTSQTLTATGGTAMEFPPEDRASMYVWSATGLPTGLTLSNSGVLSGAPTESGTYDPQITLADAAGNVPSLTATFNLNVALAPLGFTTTTLTAIQGESYTGQIVAQGGQSPYSLAFLSGSLPAGLHFNDGTITGTPTATPGNYQFSIGLSDNQSSPATASETFNMEIAPSETSPDLGVTGTSTESPWAGYVEQASAAFTAVSGTFTVPALRDSPTNSVAPWVGIDGYGAADLIQAGVSAIGGDGTTSYKAWWETVPSPVQDQFDVTPGDAINVNIWQISSGKWEITLDDTTSGQGFAAQVSYTGSGDLTAEWIVETPDGSAPAGYAATSTFTNLQGSQAGNGMLEQPSTGVTVSSLTNGGFSISDDN